MKIASYSNFNHYHIKQLVKSLDMIYLTIFLTSGKWLRLLQIQKRADSFCTDIFCSSDNKAVRQTLIRRGIKPEEVSPKEDVKKVERKLNTETKKALKSNESLKIKDDKND